MARKRKRRTLDEVFAELEKDSEWVRKRREQEAELQLRLNEKNPAEAPVVEALGAVGVRVTSVWNLVNTKAGYPAAIPILFDHLQRRYPPEILAGIARALGVPEARVGWLTLMELFQANQEEKVNGVKTALACALSGAADEDLIPDIIALVQDRRHGEHRIVFLAALADSIRSDARAALELAAEDPQLVREATRLLRLLARRERRG